MDPDDPRFEADGRRLFEGMLHALQDVSVCVCVCVCVGIKGCPIKLYVKLAPLPWLKTLLVYIVISYNVSSWHR